MKFNILKKKVSHMVVAGVLGVVVNFSAYPSPQAEALDWGGVLGKVVGAGVQLAEMDNQLRYLDNDGRYEVLESIRANNGVNYDVDLNARLDDIMANLTAGVRMIDPSVDEKPYNYFINNDPTFNAFCTLGHNLSVNSGLFEIIQNDDEIAVVIGHEIGHGQKNHVMAGFHKSIPVILGSAVLSDATGGIGGEILGAVVQNQLTAKQITKPMEWDADELAFEYICKTTYNPGACAALWQRVTEQMNQRGTDDFVGELFAPSDHPSNEQRRDKYAKMLSEMSDDRMTVYDGLITLNNKNFLKCADDLDNGMSAAERAYFIAGNLARVYENTNEKKMKKKYKKELKMNPQMPEPKLKALPSGAYAADGNLYIDDRYILTEVDGEPSAAELADIFNLIK